jgi:CHAD domain-containing protein
MSLIKSIKHGLGKQNDVFKAKHIHNFRLGIKKLKAIIRLIDSLIVSKSHKNLLKPLKGLYGKTGKIRDLHVHLSIAKGLISQSPIEVKTFGSWSNKQIEKEQVSIVKEIGRLDSDIFKNIENFFRDFRKSNLEIVTNDCVNFVQQKLQSISGIIALEPSDENLHSIRKLLKDVVYTLQILKNEDKSFSIEKSKLKLYNRVQEQLGLWNDWVTFGNNLKKLNKKEPQFPDLEWIATIEKDKYRNLVLESLKKIN